MTAAAVVTLVAGCKPSDQKVKSVRERLEAGETVEFTKPGMKTPNCGPAEWNTIKVSSKQERDRVILGSQYSIVNAGYKFCGRIGLPVDMTVYKDDKGLGAVIVQKISMVKLDKLKPNQLKGNFFANTSDFDFYKANIKLYPENQGIVTIIDTHYAEGTAKDEKAVRQRGDEDRNTDGYKETSKDGEFIASNCKTTWSDLAVAEEFQNAVLSGAIGSWYSVGDLNCVPQGATVNIKAKVGKAGANEPIKGQVKVVKIKKLRMSFLDQRYFDMRGFDFEKLKAQIAKDDTKRDEWITILDFENKQTELKQITIQRSEVLDDGKATTSVQGEVDFKMGELVVVNVVNADNTISKMQATVIGWMKFKDTTAVQIKLITDGGPK